MKGYWVEWIRELMREGGEKERVVIGMVKVDGRGGGMEGVVGGVRVVEGWM